MSERFLTKDAVLQQLTLSISDGIFINPAGAAVVWSPAVPGSITDSSVRGNSAEAEAYFPSCMPSKTAGEWQQAPVNLTLLQDALDPAPHESDSSADSLSRSVTAVAANSEAVSGPPDASTGSEEAPIAQLHLHIPAEAYFMTTLIQEVAFYLVFHLAFYFLSSSEQVDLVQFDSFCICIYNRLLNTGERCSRCACVADMAR